MQVLAVTRPGLSSGRSDLSLLTKSWPLLAGGATILQREEGRDSELLAWQGRYFDYMPTISQWLVIAAFVETGLDGIDVVIQTQRLVRRASR